ncbi:polycomb protein [Heyndrickxia oleronia]|uniref:hypothetical protein n=1 Tax=Heyndrickxia oleronia TaxID=38875 RepID=UPI000A82FC65|nr:hypothetical protein [Heyndrickxia oleronia]MCM3454795.1 polycomb protein [Heyndrickxia oleronia]
MKVSCTVWSRGKDGDNIKFLPIAIKESGGVLQFESLLTGKPFTEVKQKYFGHKRKKYHPAELLSPKQLELIDWAEIKRNHFEEYKQSLEEIMTEWNAHVREQRILAFAKLLIGLESMKYQLVVENIQNQSEETQIPSLLNDVLTMYSCRRWEDWALEARIIAGEAYRTAKLENNQMANALIYVLFSFQHYKQHKQSIDSKNSLIRVG